MNLPAVAAEVTRRMPLNSGLFRLLTSAATFFGFKSQNVFGGILNLSLSPLERERMATRPGEGNSCVLPFINCIRWNFVIQSVRL